MPGMEGRGGGEFGKHIMEAGPERLSSIEREGDFVLTSSLFQSVLLKWNATYDNWRK